MSNQDSHVQGRWSATLMGIGAILLWGMSIAMSRRVTEQLGVLPASAWLYFLSGLMGTGYFVLTGRGRKLTGMPFRHLLLCGVVFVAYGPSLYLAVGLAVDRQQAVEVGIINYLWPSLTLVFSLPVLGFRARWWLWLGMAAAVAGVAMAMFTGQAFTWSVLANNLRAHWIPYGLALNAAVLWGLYSNLTRRLSRGVEGSAAPLYLLATGVVLMLSGLAVPHEAPAWTPRAVVELFFMAAGPGMLAYVLWDIAMRRGHMILVTAMSYAIPLLSTLISCLLLGVRMGPTLWAACGLVIGGAVLCKFALRDPADEHQQGM